MSLLDTTHVSPITPRFRFHPLMAVYLESITSAEHKTLAWKGLAAFLESRMLIAKDVNPDERKNLQDEIVAEWLTFTDWLERMPDAFVNDVSKRFGPWGFSNGPFMAWAHLHKRASRIADTPFAGIIARLECCDVLRLACEFGQSEQMARETRDACGDEFPQEKALAWGM